MTNDYAKLEEKIPATEKQPEPQAKIKKKSVWTSISGALVHSLTWLKGKSRDTVRINPRFHPSSSLDATQPEYHIYCIHGTADRSYAFNAMANELLKDIPGEIPPKNSLPSNVASIQLLAFDGRAQGKSIEYFADQVKSKIIKNKHKNIIFMAHSRGGLVAAKATEDMAKDAGFHVGGVLAFCPPLDGSPLAKAPFTYATSVRQMKHNSEFLRTLRPAVEKTNEESKKYYYFGAENDSIVPTENTYIKEGCHSATLLPGHGHLSVLRSKATAGYASDCLHQIARRPIAAPADTIPSATMAYREIDAEIIAFKNRTHMASISSKLKVLTDLRTLLGNMRNGDRGNHFLTARTVSEFIQQYLTTADAKTGISPGAILKKELNWPVTIFKSAPPKAQVLMDELIRTYQDVLLPVNQAPMVSPLAVPVIRGI